MISETIKLAMYVDGVVAALPVKDTIKEVTRDGLIKGTPNRDSLWFAQTPQTFKKRVLEEAFMRAFTDKFHGTDEASLVERMGGKVKIIEGSHENIKITTKEDLFYAELILRSRRKKET